MAHSGFAIVLTGTWGGEWKHTCRRPFECSSDVHIVHDVRLDSVASTLDLQNMGFELAPDGGRRDTEGDVGNHRHSRNAEKQVLESQLVGFPLKLLNCQRWKWI